MIVDRAAEFENLAFFSVLFDHTDQFFRTGCCGGVVDGRDDANTALVGFLHQFVTSLGLYRHFEIHGVDS